MSYRAILLPLEGSAFAERAINFAASLARAGHASPLAAMVHQPLLAARIHPTGLHPVYDPELAVRARDQDRAYLEETADRITKEHRVAAEPVFVEGEPAACLRETIGARGVDLVAMSTHGRSGFSRFRLGSVADKVVRGSDVPVLVTRAQAAPGPNQPR